MASFIDSLQNLGNGLSGVLIGATIGIYTTITFQRYTKFKDAIADLAYRTMTLGEHVAQIDHRGLNPAQLWIAASSVVRDHIQPVYFLLAVRGHDRAKKKLDAQLNEILDELFRISDDIAKRSPDDPELVDFQGNRSLLVSVRWGFHFHRFRDVWTERMMDLEPNWEMVFGLGIKNAPEPSTKVI